QLTLPVAKIGGLQVPRHRKGVNEGFHEANLVILNKMYNTKCIIQYVIFLKNAFSSVWSALKATPLQVAFQHHPEKCGCVSVHRIHNTYRRNIISVHADTAWREPAHGFRPKNVQNCEVLLALS